MLLSGYKVIENFKSFIEEAVRDIYYGLSFLNESIPDSVLNMIKHDKYIKQFFIDDLKYYKDQSSISGFHIIKNDRNIGFYFIIEDNEEDFCNIICNEKDDIIKAINKFIDIICNTKKSNKNSFEVD